MRKILLLVALIGLTGCEKERPYMPASTSVDVYRYAKDHNCSFMGRRKSHDYVRYDGNIATMPPYDVYSCKGIQDDVSVVEAQP